VSALTVTGVEKAFDDEVALRGVDFDVESGEIVLLMGPNGAGKSVLSSCISGASEPDAGTVELFDGASPTEARGRTGLLLQGETLDPKLTGRENLRFRRQLHPHGTDDWRRLAERFELADHLDRVVDDYSGGMRQKVELLAALSADVPLYLLDEPASALDLSMLQVLHDELLALREAGKTVLLTSHTPLDAQVADRLVSLRDGRRVAVGDPDDLLANLPDVVRIRGGVPDESLLLGGRSFHRGDEVRGFLPAETSLADVRASLEGEAADALVEIDPPSFTDLFNCYAHVTDGRDATSERREVAPGVGGRD